MGESDESRIVRWPSEEETKIAFETYALAVGKVAHSWNYLHEKLSSLYATVCGGNRKIALSVWHAVANERTQQLMLKAAVLAAPEEGWAIQHPKSKNDLDWLCEKVRNLGDQRNNAIHAPCILSIGADGSRMIPAPPILSDHIRAKNLRGKEILVEFDYVEKWAERLSIFAQVAESALLSKNYPWPDKPEKPVRLDMTLLGLPFQTPPE